VSVLTLPLIKKTSKSKPKRKPGTRAGLTKSAIAAGATKLIETVGPAEFSLRKLASAMGVGPTSIHAHFKGGTEAVLEAISVQALAGTTRPFKPMEEPAEYFANSSLRSCWRCTLGRPSPVSSFCASRQVQSWIRCSPNVYF
jgi:AcrR family transcriptional regulator